MLSKVEFKQLFDNYFDQIRSFIFYRCGDTDVASDMAQDIFMKIWEKREQLYNSDLKPLLYKMANDMVVSNYRKVSTRMDYENNMRYQNNSPLSPEEELHFEELASAYAKALEKMPETQRVVFLMSRNDELKYHEIAGCLDISVKAVEKRMSAALSYLRNELL
ncbi:RNA polymerase sigma factor [Massilibacteroides vaginae]|uniref:RNA polymerase sigma factor n=1 Tax=Massilibacteroides vaginae TaxID=1673718 RepID=UPI000A1C9838|nr:sigma-70 family RNA polymerase sigma factor [Massilibacteroides vaginae]